MLLSTKNEVDQLVYQVIGAAISVHKALGQVYLKVFIANA